jgi:hypothetical protein
MKRQATRLEREWMAAVADMGCIACELAGDHGTPAQVHHVHVEFGWGRTSHYATIPLCKTHHTDGPMAVHVLSRDNFTRCHGVSELQMLEIVHARMGIGMPFEDQ